ncbi:hypothetical protein CGCA056_v005211 [Colletotrichum aenigma]|uniref:uncharacterized protein n=1 Tax=Colletotrichum aenigma TaxID=1215731 RepID=UPI0018726F5A|nr:uncharacterized protein CGCA056_v005211 [Colletotrichum aenigma]KAF5524028.1 hypothetical protein CGCA056_v005211 [Colletotrichum aenigma]
MKPDAVVNLAVRHFETVRDAYLKFAEAILVDESDYVVSDTRAGGRVDRKEAYRQSQSPCKWVASASTTVLEISMRKAILNQAIRPSRLIEGRLKATRNPNP